MSFRPGSKSDFVLDFARYFLRLSEKNAIPERNKQSNDRLTIHNIAEWDRYCLLEQAIRQDQPKRNIQIMPGMKASSEAPRDGESHSQRNQTHFPKSTERNHNCTGKEETNNRRSWGHSKREVTKSVSQSASYKACTKHETNFTRDLEKDFSGLEKTRKLVSSHTKDWERKEGRTWRRLEK
jgi:hypothetical protein